MKHLSGGGNQYAARRYVSGGDSIEISHVFADDPMLQWLAVCATARIGINARRAAEPDSGRCCNPLDLGRRHRVAGELRLPAVRRRKAGDVWRGSLSGKS